LWEEDSDDVAQRLGWPLESKTSTSSSYRLYPRHSAPVFGRRAYAMALHAEDDRPISLSFIFANKGDVPYAVGELRQPERDYKRLIRADARALTDTLTDLFGRPISTRMGDSRQTSESVRRWDWEGHSFLLAAPRDEYVSLRIVASSAIDQSGIERIPRRDLKQTLASRIQRRANGDVILSDLPMVNQGPKGYCVPATWERALRYMGIPADMYVLAMAGETGFGGGTNTKAISDGARDLVRRHGRRIRVERGRLTLRGIAAFIEDGLPVIWAMYSMPSVDRELSRRMRERSAITDWPEWSQRLSAVRRTARRIQVHPTRGHVCLIIGYNAATRELAVSDSWGPQFAERWITLEEAEAISQGEIMIIYP